MKKFKILSVVILSMLLSACGVSGDGERSDKIQVVSSFTIVSDIVEQIGGDLLEVYNLVPTGTMSPCPMILRQQRTPTSFFLMV